MLVLVAANMNLHGASPWHLETLVLVLVAANMNLHGASPWHLETFSAKLSSWVTEFVFLNLVVNAAWRDPHESGGLRLIAASEL